jgi:hypothetical protein
MAEKIPRILLKIRATQMEVNLSKQIGGRNRRFALGYTFVSMCVSAGLCSCEPMTGGAGGGGPPPTKEELHAIAARGQPIVTGIYRFKQERGLWPCSLDELSPDFIKDAQTKAWRLNWHPSGWWQLICQAGGTDWAVRYGHNGNDDGWAITDGVHDELLKIKQPLPPPSTLSEAHIRENRVRHLYRRIERDPKRIVHRQALVATLYNVKDYKAARQVCIECQREWPEHYWPYLMLARIDAGRGDAATAEEKLRKWTYGHKEFNYYFLFAQFLYERGDKKGARVALRDGANFPLSTLFGSERAGENLGWTGTVFSWYGAMMAYDEKWYAIARQICTRWEEYLEKRTVDPGYCAVLAACELAQGNYDQASVEAKRARKLLRDRNYDWTANFNELEKAIEAKDKTFHYRPRFISSYVLLPIYE